MFYTIAVCCCRIVCKKLPSHLDCPCIVPAEQVAYVLGNIADVVKAYHVFLRQAHCHLVFLPRHGKQGIDCKRVYQILYPFEAGGFCTGLLAVNLQYRIRKTLPKEAPHKKYGEKYPVGFTLEIKVSFDKTHYVFGACIFKVRFCLRRKDGAVVEQYSGIFHQFYVLCSYLEIFSIFSAQVIINCVRSLIYPFIELGTIFHLPCLHPYMRLCLGMTAG